MKQVTFDPNVRLKSVRRYCLVGILISLATFGNTMSSVGRGVRVQGRTAG